MELGVWRRDAAAAMLWDFEKFFDNMGTERVLSEGLRLGFPVVDLLLGQNIHLASRRLQLSGYVSQPICVYGSILPGCALAIPFTRIFMRAAYDDVLSPRVCQAERGLV